MNRTDLYRNGIFSNSDIYQVLQVKYQNYIDSEINRLLGYTNNKMSNKVLSCVCARLQEISMDCDILSLIFDCIRKIILNQYIQDFQYHNTVKNQLLRGYIKDTEKDQADKLRLEIVLAFFFFWQREYFFGRYYYLNDCILINKRYERIISRLYEGRDIASIRFHYFKLKRKKANPSRYITCFNYLDSFYINYLSNLKSNINFSKEANIPAFYIFAERQFWISKYFIIIIALILSGLVLVFLVHLISISLVI